jgi:hypothetical protein
LSNDEASAALKFSGKRAIGLQKLVYLYQETFLKRLTVDGLHNIIIK